LFIVRSFFPQPPKISYFAVHSRKTMEHISCPVCNNQSFSTFTTTWDRFVLAKGQAWPIMQCKTCNFIFLNPRPDANEIGRYYEAMAYDPFVNLNARPSMQQRLYTLVRKWVSLRWKARTVLREFRPQQGKTYNVLEIGAATGEFLAELRELQNGSQFNLYGIEKTEKAACYARDVMHLDVFTGELLEYDSAKKFHLIAMWHTLEHILRLNETVSKLATSLADDGLLVVAMPNTASRDAAFYGSKWIALDTPRHLYHFTPKTFRRLLDKHGLYISASHGIPLDSFYNAYMSEALSDEISGRKSSAMTAARAIMRGVNFVLADASHASSVVYYIRKNQD
jgi:2-polyprenyl-3-methyl-5-hydroxy-6-metoxy-1,4-benzoquinol methylase